MVEAPPIDQRSEEDIFHALVAELKNPDRLGINAEEDPLAKVLLRIFSRYCDTIIQRLNKVPDKNYLAFLDTLNIARLPAVPAQAPLTFTLVKKLPNGGGRARAAIVVPAFTKVAAPPGDSGNESVVFETTRALTLTNIELSKIFTIDPQADLYRDRSALASPEGGEGAFAFVGKQAIAHEFYLGPASVFAKPGISRLCLDFVIAGDQYSRPRSHPVVWWLPTPDGKVVVRPTEDTTSHLTQSGTVVFRDLPDWPVHLLWGRETQWLACSVVGGLPYTTAEHQTVPSQLPIITKVTISATGESVEVPVESAFFNNIPLDLSKDFFPLGERPRFGDVLYLACSAFSTPQAKISLTIRLTNPASGGDDLPIPPVNTAGKPKLQWEYWNGQRWNALECRDGSENFTKHGEIEWQMPSSAMPSGINGQEGCWIRVRLVSGNYGEEERLVFSGEQGLQRTPATLAAPSIQSLGVIASAHAEAEVPRFVITHNNFEFEAIDPMVPFQPFRVSQHPERALYFGFRVPETDLITLSDRTLDVYFHISGSENRTALCDSATQQLPTLVWQYWNGKEWIAARVEDGTEALSLSGIVSLQTGADIAPWQQSSCESSLYWIRVLWKAGVFATTPKLQRILLNTVPASQSMTLFDETLGSSTGRPKQVFRTARSPILKDMRLEVREPAAPLDESGDTVSGVREPGRRPQEVWGCWYERDHFLLSHPDDRHFTVDREHGEIRFGDGINGAIPSRGVNNLRLSHYQVGGGSVGNTSAGSLAQLRTTIPYVASVVNLESACGGQDIEDWDSVKERGSRWLRNRARAVTQEDYEDMARVASPSVANVRCYPSRNLLEDPNGQEVYAGMLSLIIVPWSTDPKPAPDLALLARVRSFLNKCRTPDTDLVLLAPEYVSVSVEVVIVAENPTMGASLAIQCESELAKYLHPLTGGADGKGWEFGQQPYDSDLYAMLEAIPGLEYVRSLSLRLDEDRPGLLRSGMFLISSGEHRVRLGA